MDTDDKYLDCDFYVTLAGEQPPEPIRDGWRENTQKRVDDPDDPLADRGDMGRCPETHPLNDDVPIDGQVTFYWPEKLGSGDPFKAFDFPFRGVDKDDAPWFARPDADKWSRHPVWKWKNPDAPLDRITLHPSLGIGPRDDLSFHAYIRGGDIDWL